VKAEARLLLAMLAVTACGHGSKPSPAPSPVPSLTRAASAPVAASGLDSTGRVPRDTIARLDSVRVSIDEVMNRAQDVFGDTAGLRHADSVTAPVADEPSWDIDVRSYATHERVAHYVEVFRGRARDVFIEWLERGSRYEPMIRAKFRAANIPEDMYYLGLVESGFDPNAYSRAAAVGMWQFMSSTARGSGLRVDWWVDDRRDPVRSTDAAVKFLGFLREQFGSLYLAAAAYNGGPGRVSRGLTRYASDLDGTTGDDRFFALADKDYLRGETKNYVPQLIAAALIAKAPEKYGVSYHKQPPFVYDSVMVAASTPLPAVAKATGATVTEIRQLNPRVLRGVTPPDARFQLRVPLGSGAAFDSLMAAFPESDRVAYRREVAKKGQTMASLANLRGISARQLAWYNPKLEKLKSGRLRAGQTVLVPTRAVADAAVDVPDPAIEIWGSGSRSARGARTHLVHRGETLGSVAKKYDTSISTLVRLNGLKKRVIYPGQTIIVRAAPRSSARTASAKGKASTTASHNGSSEKPVTAAPKKSGGPRIAEKATVSR
jgi:membrane-bound lytic murein transglycosylase D